MANRNNKNLHYVMRRLDEVKFPPILEDEVMDIMDTIQYELCDRYGALQGSVTIPILSSNTTGVYPLGETISAVFYYNVGRVITYVRPTSWKNQLVFTSDPVVFAEAKARYTTTSTEPIIALMWNKNIEFWPVPTVTVSLVLYCWKLPYVTIVEGTADPVIDAKWDSALTFGTLADIIGGPWGKQYEEEAIRQANLMQVRGPDGFTCDTKFSRLGF